MFNCRRCIYLVICVLFLGLIPLGFFVYYQTQGAFTYQTDDWNTTECRYNEGMSWHCGSCGNCSTTQDLEVYKNTSNTIMDLMKKCVFYQVAGGNIETCVDDNIGLTDSCKQCWLKNVECTASNCWGLCLYEDMFDIPHNAEDGALSKCLSCDEHYCGKSFRECAGMTRRRAGIVTNIIRDKTEVCDIEY